MDASEKFNTDSPAPLGVSTDSAIIFESCPACHTTVNVTSQEPLSSAECPDCRSEFVVGEFIDHYQLLSIAGRGGMGVVYRALDTSLNRELALKVLRKDRLNPQTMAQIETEAAITASINHPHVVKVFTTGTDHGRFYIAMELVHKGTLDDLMRIQGRVAEAQVLDVAIQVAQGLRAAYTHGLIHRDVKPGNILFSDAHTAKIVDFGLAMFEQASAEAAGTEIWGTPYYVSPEKLDQQPEDLRSDIYSLGASLFHALAGRPPFEAEDANMVALKHLKNQAVSLQSFAPWVSGSTAYVINRTLLKNPDQRYQTYDEFIEHLEYAKSQLLAQAAQPQAKSRVVLESDENQKLWSYLTFGMIAACIALGLGFFFFVHKSPTHSKPAAAASTLAGSVSAAYEAARQQLLSGQYDAAARSFAMLSENSNTPAPMRQWSTLQAGLGELLAERPDQARIAFAALAKQTFDGATPADRELGNFFQDVAKREMGAKPAPANAANDFNKSTYAAMGLLVLGLQDWTLGQYDDAGALLRAFESAPINNDNAWLTEYKSLAGDYVADFSDFRGALGLLKAASTPEEIAKARDGLIALKGELRRKSGLARRIDAAVEEATPAKAKAAAAPAKATAATAPAQPSGLPTSTIEDGMRASPRIKAINDSRDKLTEWCTNFQISDAVNAATHLESSGPTSRLEKFTLVRKVDWIGKFKSLLDGDITAHGYNQPMKKADGSVIKGVVEKSTSAGLVLKGGAVIPWREVSPESVLQAGTSFLKSAPNRREAAIRMWTAGVYALLTRQTIEARQLLSDAAKQDIEFAEALPMLLPSKPVNFARDVEAIASSAVAKASEFPESAVDGSDASKWCTNLPGPCWLQLDLHKEFVINRWIVKHAEAGGEPAGYNTVDFALEKSADGASWTTVDPVKGNSAAITNRSVPSFASRYVRLNISKRSSNGDPAARVYEFELYGPSSTEPPDLFAPVQLANTPNLTGANLGGGNASSGSSKANESTGEYTIVSSGSDIDNKTDAGRFLNRPTEGNVKIIAFVDSIENVDKWSKCGVMFRENADPDSRFVFLTRSASAGMTLQVRSEKGARSINTDEPSLTSPCWLKLLRHEDVFTAFTSADGIEWKQYGSPQTVKMSPQALVGLAASAHSAKTLCTSKVTDLRITNE